MEVTECDFGRNRIAKKNTRGSIANLIVLGKWLFVVLVP